MIKAGQISKGMCLIIKNAPHVVVEREFINPGKGSAFVRVKLKNLIHGSSLRETIKSNDNVEEADVFDKSAQFLYADNDGYHFMDMETYEQYPIERNGMEDKEHYLKEGDTYRVVFFSEKVIDIQLPPKMTFTVVEAPEALRGDTVGGATKMVRCETGLNVKVPIFIRQDERILVNTETGEYVERVNK
ncbi:MAG: elongation factor P [Salinispira sp.]